VKKATLLNSEISGLIARLGHGDSICIADAGLPIPDGVRRIDLAVTQGCPSFADVLAAVSSEMFVEQAVLASELAERQPEMQNNVDAAMTSLASEQGTEIPLHPVAHEEFKALTRNCKAVIRTGECTPYSNILHAGVTF